MCMIKLSELYHGVMLVCALQVSSPADICVTATLGVQVDVQLISDLV